MGCGERRATLRALRYWQGLCGSDSLPRGHAGVDEWTPDELCDALFVIRLRSPANLSPFLRAGTALERICDKPVLGRPIGDPSLSDLAEVLGDLARNVATFRKPIPSSGSTRLGDGRAALYRGILLPLGDAEGRVVAALGAIGCRPIITPADVPAAP